MRDPLGFLAVLVALNHVSAAAAKTHVLTSLVAFTIATANQMMQMRIV